MTSPSLVIDHGAVAVLTNAPLLATIADFQSGLPLAVLSFQRENAAALSMQLMRHDTKLLGDGVLVHMAVAARDTQLLALLHRLAARERWRHQRAPWQRDRRLSFARVSSCAVLFRRADVLACVAELEAAGGGKALSTPTRGSACAWCEAGLMRLALRRPPDVDLRVLEWLFAHVPAERRALQPSDVVVYARSGNLAVVRWLVERCGCAVTRAAVDAAVHGRRPHVLEYLYERSSARCSRTAVDDAARNGYTDIVRVIVSGRRRRAASSADNDNEDDDDAYRSALSGAARNGHLETVKLLAESDIATHDAPRAIDYSAENGHLGVVAYLHERFGQARSNLSSVVNVSDARARGDANAGALRHPRGATANAICTTAALDGAARNGYLEVVKFLHAHRREGCTAAAMDSAAENGHLDIVRFLHEHRREGCTLSALERAVAKCHWDVISFLCDHRLECDVALSLANAVSSSSIGIVKHLHKHLRPEDSAYNALKVAVQESKVEIVKWFCRNQDREPTRFLTRAIADGAPWIAQAVLRFVASREELIEAKAAALEANQPRIVNMVIEHLRQYGRCGTQ